MHRTAATRLTHLSALATLLFLCLGTAASAQTTRNVPGTYPHIQDAIAAAVNGDTVLVAPGTYPENIDFLGKAIVVTSDTAIGGSPANTIIDGGGPTTNKPTVQFVSGETSTSIISGFTIRNGSAMSNQAGGGVLVYQSNPVISGNVITQNTCYGIYVGFAEPLIQRNTITQTVAGSANVCSLADGAGIFLSGHRVPDGPLPTLTAQIIGNTITQNTQNAADGSPRLAGALYLYAAGAPVIQRNIITNNTSSDEGGALAMYNSSTVFLVSNLIIGNRSGRMGAIVVEANLSTIGPPTSVIANNTISDNVTTETAGASADDASQLYIEGNLAQTVVANNIIFGSSATLPAFSCGTTFSSSSITPVIIEANDIYNPLGPTYGGACSNQTGTFGNITVDPQFTNSAGGNYHLSLGSPAIDAGNTSVLTDLYFNKVPLVNDLDGNARVVDATGKGYPIIDMGAYEVQGSIDNDINTLFLSSTGYEVPGGSTITLTAALFTSATSPSLSSVAFTEDGNPLGTAPVVAATNSLDATLTTPPLVPGLHVFVATYPTSGSAPPAKAVHVFVLVDPYFTTLTLTCPASPAAPGSPVSFGISLTSSPNGPPPNATVTLYDNGSTTPFDTVQLSANGTYTYTTSSLTLGAHNISAQYAGTLDYQPAASNICRLTISGPAQIPTATTLTAAPGTTVAVGTPVAFTAQVTNTASTTGPIPVGTVNLLDGSTLLATQSLDATGVAHFAPISSLTVGPHTITANYIPAAGTPSFAQSSYSLIETITTANSSTLLTANPNPAFALAPVTLTATVTAPNTTTAPTGTVNFLDGTAVIGSATLVNGQATTTAQFSANPATHSLTAVYSGNGSLSTSTSNTVLERINPLPSTTTINAAPSTAPAFTAIHLTSHTSSAATTPVNAPACNGQCTPLVTFVANGNAIGTSPVDANGNAALTITPPAGAYSITATFSGSGIFTSSTSTPPATVIITALGTSLALVGNPSTVVVRQPVLLTAILAASGAPASALSGPITFSDGGTLLATGSLSNGVATLTYAPTTPGTHLITAVFAGTASLAPASASFILNVTPRDFTITTASPSLAIRTEHHASIQVQVATEGGLVDTIVLSCANLPQWATCTYHPGALSINQTATPADSTTSASTLTIDTDFVLGYAQLRPTEKPATRGLRTVTPIAFAVLIPGLALFGLRRRTRLPRLLLAALLSVAVLSAAGCSGLYPPHTVPGTYTINVTGLAQNNNLTRSTPLTLIVTP